MRRSDQVRSFLRLTMAAAALSACNPAVMNTDAGHTGVDSGADAGGAAVPDLPAAVANGAAAGLACLGTATQPAQGQAISFTMDLQAFGQHGDHAPMIDLCFCGDNVVPLEALGSTAGQCGTCQALTTDATGHVTVMGHTGGWYGYRVFAHSGHTHSTTFLDSVQVNEVAPMAAGATVVGNAVSVQTQEVITAAELLTRAPGSYIIAGRFFDCANNDLSNVIVRAFHEDGSEVFAGESPSAPHVAYFDGDENPDANATYSNTDGLYAVINVPPVGDHEAMRVEAWAFTGTGTGAATMIGCEVVEAFSNGVSIVNIGPQRSDYEASSACHH